MIRDVQIDDAARLAEIYNPFITESIITFEETTIGGQDFEDRIDTILGYNLPWIVWEESGQLAGYAYATRWRTRAAYRHSCEAAIYLDPSHKGKGIGSSLYAHLFERLKILQFHTVFGLVSLPNPASVRLHEKFGFKKVGVLKETGRKFDHWIDVGIWQLMLSEFPSN